MQYRSFFFGLLQRGSPVEEAVDAAVAVDAAAVAVAAAVAPGPVAVAPGPAAVAPARPAAVLVHPAVARHGPTLIALRRLARPVPEHDRAAADQV